MTKLKLPSHNFKAQRNIKDTILNALKGINTTDPKRELNNILYIIKSTALFLECSNKLNAHNMVAECADYLAWNYEALKGDISFAYKAYRTSLPTSVCNLEAILRERKVERGCDNKNENIIGSRFDDIIMGNSSVSNVVLEENMCIEDNLTSSEGLIIDGGRGLQGDEHPYCLNEEKYGIMDLSKKETHNEKNKNCRSDKQSEERLQKLNGNTLGIVLEDKERSQIDRLTQVYLYNYDISYFSYELRDGWVVLTSEFFIIYAVLCGDLSGPRWKIAKTETSIKEISDDVFSSIEDLGEVLDFVEYYESCRRSKDYIKKILDILKQIDIGYTISGDHLNCTISAQEIEVVIKVKANKFRCKINDVCLDGDIVDYFKDKLKAQIDKKIGESDSIFDFENGICYKGCKIRIEDIDSLIADKKEEEQYNAFKAVAKGYVVIKNWHGTKFGQKNILIHDNDTFICVRLDYLKMFCGRIDDIENCKELYICLEGVKIQDSVKKPRINKVEDNYNEVRVGDKETKMKDDNYKIPERGEDPYKKTLSKEQKKKVNQIKNNKLNNKESTNQNVKLFITNNPGHAKYSSVTISDILEFLSLNIDVVIKTYCLYSFNFKVCDYVFMSCKIRNYIFFCKISSNIASIKYAKASKDTTAKSIKSIKYNDTIIRICKIIDVINAIKFIILKDKLREVFTVEKESQNELEVSQNELYFTVSFVNTLQIVSTNTVFERLIRRSLPDALYFAKLALFLVRFLSLGIFPLSFDNHTVLIATHHISKKNLQVTYVKQNHVYLKNQKKLVDTSAHKNFYNAIFSLYSKNRFFEIKHYACKMYKLIECYNEGNKIYEKVNWHMTFQSESLSFKVTLTNQLGFEFMVKEYECLNKYVRACLNSADMYLKIFDFLCIEKIGKIREKIKNN